MVIPADKMELARQLFGGAAGSPAQQDPRLRISQLSTAATIAAARASCKCKACKMLRRLVDITMAEAEKELEVDVAGDNPEA